MGHDHDHHDHNIQLDSVNQSLWIGIGLNIAFVIIEVLAGWYYQSLGLLSDAGHNLSDVASLLIALLAFKLTSVRPTQQFTYGFKKSTILAAFVNALILFGAVGIILWESIERIQNPVKVGGLATAVVAGVGIVINSLTAWLFLKNKEKDLNIKGAYVHMVADALVSLGVVLSGLIIWYSQWYWIDTLISLVIVIIIVWSSWDLFKDSVRLILDGVPKDINLTEVKNKITQVQGVVGVHHVHVWALSTTENALTAHLVIDDEQYFEDLATLKAEVRHILAHENIKHATLEIEKSTEDCTQTPCDDH